MAKLFSDAQFNVMFKLILPVLLFNSLSACNTPSIQNNPTGGTNSNTANMPEGKNKDYIILKRFRITDSQGFSQPVEASSFLLPANWQVNGSVQWNAYNKCIPEMVQASLQAKSPDGAYELLVFPVTQFDWSDDPIQLDAMKRGFYLHACNIAQPLDAQGYIKNVLTPYLKGSVKTARIITELQQQMDAGAMQMTNAARQAGNGAYNHRGSAAEGVLQFNDGRAGLAFCTVMQTIVTMPGTQGGMANNWQCYVSMRIVLKYKTGDEAMARKIMGTLFSSTRINPTWWNGLQGFFMAVTKNAQDENWKHIQEVHKVQEEMGNNIIRSWEAKNSTSTSGGSGAAPNSDAFGQYLRGVDNWTDADGNKVELTSGYTNAWSKGDGSYVLSNNPAFDPNVEFKDTQSWNRLKQ